MAKIELTGGHIEFTLIIEMAKIEINRRPYWIYACYRDNQDKINQRPYWIYANYRNGQNRNQLAATLKLCLL